MKIRLTKSPVKSGILNILSAVVLLVFMAGSAHGKKAVSVMSGNWGDSSVWSFSGGIDSAHHADTVLINSGHTITFLGIYRSTSIVFMRVFTNGVLSPMGNNSEMILADSNAIFQLDSGAFLRNNSGNNSNHSFQIGNQGIWGRKTCNNNAMTGLSQFTKATPCGGWAALPVTLAAFNAKGKNGQLHVEWTTSGETNNSHFIVQISFDGVNFLDIGKIKSAPASQGNDIRQYHFVYSGLPNTNDQRRVYVKLLQSDLDGTLDMLRIAPVDIKTETLRFVYHAAESCIRIPASESQTVAEVYSAGGVKLLSQQIGPLQSVAIDLSGLSSGLYVLTILKEGIPEFSDRFCIRN